LSTRVFLVRASATSIGVRAPMAYSYRGRSDWERADECFDERHSRHMLLASSHGHGFTCTAARVSILIEAVALV
jgi:hypothetical protein